MIPYHDENETQRPAVVTLAIIAACVLTWIFIQGAGAERPLAASVCNYGLIPGELTGKLPPGVRFPMGNELVCLTDPGHQFANVIYSMFLHGSWMHLIGNMWFLWVFGDNIEDSMGRVRFAIFYLISGVAAALLQVVFNPASGIPMVGASGAISGVMGAYLVLYPRVRVFALVVLGFFFTSIALPAWTMLLYWAAIQVVSGLFGLLAEERPRRPEAGILLRHAAQLPERAGAQLLAGHAAGAEVGLRQTSLVQERARTPDTGRAPVDGSDRCDHCVEVRRVLRIDSGASHQAQPDHVVGHRHQRLPSQRRSRREDVGLELLDGGVAEQRERRALELHHDFRDSLRQRFAHP